ncbi:MAG: SUMF1/EgtB/PvdO family nonheme iron enzyme [Deltaproteobacteria bacterium]|nr:SUMF1/EgtB/PvdO family nonheme iron enzyme [Deltaproteobacteria bacterium]
MGFDEAIVYYAIKDPTSKIAYGDGRYVSYRGTERLPVFNVSWYGAEAFCRRYGKRLFTFDEWRQATGFFRRPPSLSVGTGGGFHRTRQLSRPGRRLRLLGAGGRVSRRCEPRRPTQHVRECVRVARQRRGRGRIVGTRSRARQKRFRRLQQAAGA